MNKQREALRLALEALIEVTGWQWAGPMRVMDEVEDAISAIREALAEPEKANQCGETCERAKLCAVCANGLAEPEQEPVAWMCADEDMTRKGYSRFSRNCHGEWNIPVYTTPPARKPLTDEEIDKIIASNVTITDRNLYGAVYMAIREVEAAHGIGGGE